MRPPTAIDPHSEFADRCGVVRPKRQQWGTPAWSLAQQPDRIGEALSHCMRTTRSGMEPRRCRVTSRRRRVLSKSGPHFCASGARPGGACSEVRVAPDVFVWAERQMTDSIFPLPLRERVRQGVRGRPRTRRVRPPPHPALRATFSREGRRKGAAGLAACCACGWMAGSSPAMTAGSIVRCLLAPELAAHPPPILPRKGGGGIGARPCPIVSLPLCGDGSGVGVRCKLHAATLIRRFAPLVP